MEALFFTSSLPFLWSPHPRVTTESQKLAEIKTAAESLSNLQVTIVQSCFKLSLKVYFGFLLLCQEESTEFFVEAKGSFVPFSSEVVPCPGKGKILHKLKYPLIMGPVNLSVSLPLFSKNSLLASRAPPYV